HRWRVLAERIIGSGRACSRGEHARAAPRARAAASATPAARRPEGARPAPGASGRTAPRQRDLELDLAVGAAHVDAAAVGGDEAVDDVEPEAESGLAAALVRLEQPRQQRGVDRPGVADDD